ncbi:MAG: hypothetical protein V4673_03675 [Pseudomonadota bacterium]
MKQKARQTRLVATYWVKDPIAWAESFTPRLAPQQQSGIRITRMKVKAHPRRNPGYPYRVTLTAQVQDRAQAMQCMRQNDPICVKAGVQMSSITNAWYR